MTAAYHFRDEIKKAIGIDVVEIAKTAINFVINSFRAAYYDIGFIWGNLGNVIGAAMLGVVNAVIRGVNSMIDYARQGINKFIELVNRSRIITIELIPPNTGEIKEIVNTYSDALSQGLGERNAALAKIFESNPLGSIAAMFRSSTQETKELGKELRDLNLAGNEAAGGLNKAGKAAKEAGEAADYSRSIWDDLKSTLSGSFNRIFDSFINGTFKARDALRQLASDFAKMVANRAFTTLLNGLFGGASGGLGGFFGSLFGGARAKGGPVSSGRAYLVGERGPELMVPNMNGSVIPNEALAGGSVHVSVGVSVDNDGRLQAYVKDVADRRAVAAVRAGLSQYDRQVAPTTMRRIDLDPRRIG